MTNMEFPILLLKIKLLLLKLKKEKKNILTFFYLTNPYHFANSNEVKHDNYFCGVGNWNGYGVWTMDHPKNPILSFTQAPTTWDGPMRKPREEAFKVA